MSPRSLRLLAVLSLLALAGVLGLGWHTPHADAQAGQARIWTDKSQYQLGEPVRLCYAVPGPGPVRITNILPDGRSQVVLEGIDDGRGDCLGGTITPPTGRECVRLDYQSTRGSGSVQTCYQVVAANQPPSPPPAARPVQPTPSPAARPAPPAPELTVERFYTSDGDGNEKTTFRRGEMLFITVHRRNSGDADVTAEAELAPIDFPRGPYGDAVARRTETVPPGLSVRTLPATWTSRTDAIPDDAAFGSYTLRYRLTLNGVSSERTTTFTVASDTQLEVSGDATFPFEITITDQSIDQATGTISFSLVLTPKSHIPYMFRTRSEGTIYRNEMDDYGNLLYWPNFPPIVVQGLMLKPGGTITFEASKDGFGVDGQAITFIGYLAFFAAQLTGNQPPLTEAAGAARFIDPAAIRGYLRGLTWAPQTRLPAELLLLLDQLRNFDVNQAPTLLWDLMMTVKDLPGGIAFIQGALEAHGVSLSEDQLRGGFTFLKFARNVDDLFLSARDYVLAPNEQRVQIVNRNAPR